MNGNHDMPTLIDTIEAAAARGAAVRPRIGGFPYVAESMRAAGVTKYLFDVPPPLPST